MIPPRREQWGETPYGLTAEAIELRGKGVGEGGRHRRWLARVWADAATPATSPTGPPSTSDSSTAFATPQHPERQ